MIKSLQGVCLHRHQSSNYHYIRALFLYLMILEEPPYTTSMYRGRIHVLFSLSPFQLTLLGYILCIYKVTVCRASYRGRKRDQGYPEKGEVRERARYV